MKEIGSLSIMMGYNPFMREPLLVKEKKLAEKRKR